MTTMMVAAMLVALVSASPSHQPVPHWVDDLAASNPDQSHWGRVQFAVNTAHSLLRTGWQGQHMCWHALRRFSPRRRGWIRLDVKSSEPPTMLSISGQRGGQCALVVPVSRPGQIARDLDFVHIFSGKDSPGRAMRRRAFRAETFDILDHESKDITSCAGMLWCAILCFRVVRRGFVHFGPDCKSFAWISRYQSGRARDIMGDETNAQVFTGNVMALFVSWVCTHLHCVGVFFSIEQPVTSIFKYRSAFQSLSERVCIGRLCTHLGAFSKKMPIAKAVHLFTCASRHCSSGRE